jgi:hypothetical protein
MRTIWATLLAAIALIASLSQALAVTLSIDPVSLTIPSGGVGQLNVDIQGLPRPGPPSLGAFDLVVSDSLGTLSYTAVSFGTELGNPNLNQALVSSNAPSTGSVHLKEVSLLSAATLDSGEATSFTLATISFQAGGPEITSVGIGSITLSDGLGNPLAVSGVTGATITVTPEPTSGLLVGTGLLCLVARRSRRGT